MSCREEHEEHGGHDHHGHHGHDHDHDEPERGVQSSLYDSIDLTKVVGFNEAVEGSAQNVFRPLHEKQLRDKYVESDADEQLIIHIPFTDDVKIKSICIMGEPGPRHPSHVAAFINRDDIDFDNVEDLEPVQEWDLVEDADGEQEYETRITKFQGLHSLTLFFSDTFGGDTTKIHYIGLKGERKKVHRRTIITIAEVAARPEDHKTTIKDHTANTSKTIQ
ncbi:hypothetical protein PTSG_11684 [Salpingoeca rosetta]|uniref:PITH domain-containing protein n=1 Tax=Salpingoeca rosetta (strain ATCC 50818 / BSB-021) TaxID=946362 RepID=F2TYA6_SALR5|nr:uncharacterized protein PTSG_11684 [Salpingoeca rosetta]EGD76365.1 hypothetical protein PTSG_11684 [Salpingoeca rosetta]|eukprot:XP_004998540.1 hypothetical protein PTSG_11684 [Salpingoeca rosetta]